MAYVFNVERRRPSTLSGTTEATRSVPRPVGECQQSYLAQPIPSRGKVWQHWRYEHGGFFGKDRSLQ